MVDAELKIYLQKQLKPLWDIIYEQIKRIEILEHNNKVLVTYLVGETHISGLRDYETEQLRDFHDEK